MTQEVAFILHAAMIGLGATVFMDLWALIQRRLFGVPSLDFAMVGRWLGHIPQGRFVHDAIGRAAPVPGERAIGWVAHYATGILFAAIFLAVCGRSWALDPTPWPAMTFGMATVVVPFLLLHPGMGAGLAAAKTPNPAAARCRSLIAHLSFGVGLYLAALGAAMLLPLGVRS
jgi:hypothetical protein